MLMNKKEVLVQGIQGVVWDGILPDLYGYEAGQAATGDIFAWFANNVLSGHDVDDKNKKMIFDDLQLKASQISPGETGLAVLDWWNGNRSILINPELSGLIVGLTMNTKPEEIFRALIEATGFGTRTIIENYINHGIPVDDVIVCGGIAEKNSLLLQIYADIIGRPLYKAISTNSCALGAAIFGALVAGKRNGGYDSIQEAVAVMAPMPSDKFEPDLKAKEKYDYMFKIYCELHDFFGLGENRIMKKLRMMKRDLSGI